MQSVILLVGLVSTVIGTTQGVDVLPVGSYETSNWRSEPDAPEECQIALPCDAYYDTKADLESDIAKVAEVCKGYKVYVEIGKGEKVERCEDDKSKIPFEAESIARAELVGFQGVKIARVDTCNPKETALVLSRDEGNGCVEENGHQMEATGELDNYDGYYNVVAQGEYPFFGSGYLSTGGCTNKGEVANVTKLKVTSNYLIYEERRKTIYVHMWNTDVQKCTGTPPRGLFESVDELQADLDAFYETCSDTVVALTYETITEELPERCENNKNHYHVRPTVFKGERDGFIAGFHISPYVECPITVLKSAAMDNACEAGRYLYSMSLLPGRKSDDGDEAIFEVEGTAAVFNNVRIEIGTCNFVGGDPESTPTFKLVQKHSIVPSKRSTHHH